MHDSGEAGEETSQGTKKLIKVGSAVEENQRRIVPGKIHSSRASIHPASMIKESMTIQVTTIAFNNPTYPLKLRDGSQLPPPHKIWAIGKLDILEQKLLGFFCSARCPGDIILKTYDLARSWRDNGVGVIGGFHSPMEKECLDFLLRGKQPLVICPARGIENMRIPKNWRKSLTQGRLLVVSPFPAKCRRPTVALGMERNVFVAALADELFIPYAQPGGKVSELVRRSILLGKNVRTASRPEGHISYPGKKMTERA